MFSLESSHRGDSNEYTRYTIFNIKKKITPNYSRSAALGFISKGIENEFETAVINEPSVFEPLRVYCIGTPIPFSVIIIIFSIPATYKLGPVVHCYSSLSVLRLCYHLQSYIF